MSGFPDTTNRPHLAQWAIQYVHIYKVTEYKTKNQFSDIYTDIEQ